MAPGGHVREVSAESRAQPPPDRLGALLVALHDAVLLVRMTDRRILDVNPALLRLFGYAREELVGRSTLILHVDQTAFERMGDLVRPALMRGESILFEYTLRRRDGSVLPVQVSVSPAGGEPPEPLTAVCILRDLTESKRQEAQKAQTEALWRSVVEHAHDWFYVADEQGRVLMINRGSAGGDPDEIVGRSLYDWLSREDAERVRPIYEGVFKTGKPATFTTPATIQGHVETYECRVAPVVREGRVVAASVTSIDITERIQTQAELERTARDLEDFVETSAIGLRWLGPDGTILWANAADHDHLGYSRDEYVGHNIREFHVDAPLIEDFLKRLARDERIHDLPARLKAKDGSIRHVLIDSSVRWENGKFAHTRCFTRDVTVRRELEERTRVNARALKTLVRIQEELARTLDIERVVQAATDACTIVSGAKFGAFFYNVVNEKGESYMLYTVSGVPREAFSKFPMPQNTAVFAPTFAGERIVRSDDITKDPRYGRTAPHHGMPMGHLPVRSYLAVPVITREGTVHGGIFLGHPEPAQFNKDAEELVSAIAAQTAAAIDNSNTYRRARESEERYRSLVAHAPDQIITINGAGNILAINRTARGDPPETAIGKNVFEATVAEDRERVRGIIMGVIESRTPAHYESRGVVDGKERWFHVRVAPMTQDGMPGAVLITTDITERKQGEAELSLMRAQLVQGEKLSALGSLVSGVAHELRTPLTFLSNNTFLLKRRLDDASRRGASAAEANEEAARFLAEITTGVDRINQLIEDLRRYTRTRQRTDLSVVPLHEIIPDAIELFRATNRHSHLLETSLGRTEPILANRGAIQQITLNLLQNAADATPPGGRLRVTTRDEADRVVLEVTDEGAGIPQSVQARMFEPLFTTKTTGTGLGLSIVKRIVDEHRATITCQTAQRSGTTFRVSFPRAASAPRA